MIRSHRKLVFGFLSWFFICAFVLIITFIFIEFGPFSDENSNLVNRSIDSDATNSVIGSAEQDISYCGVELNSLTYEQKMKQLLVPAISPAEISRSITNLTGYGGYVLLDTSNQYSTEAEMIRDFELLKKDALFPPFAGLDAEGGVVQRIPNRELKNLSSLKTYEKEVRCDEIKEQGQILKTLGVNWSLAPVVDLAPDDSYWIWTRTIDDSADVVSQISTEYSNCISEEGILTTAKHFPGHGSTKLDSHLQIPLVDKSYEALDSYDFLPFKANISNDIPFIMIAHLKFISINEEISSLSSFWMEEVLRGQLGYKNLIVTDDIGMLRPQNSRECADYIVKAINSGSNLVIFASGYKCHANEVVDILVTERLLIDEIVNERVERNLQMKDDKLCN